jgi:hypothetical protein
LVRLKYRVNYRPSRLNCIFASEERAVPGHGVAQEAFIGGLLAGQFLNQIKLVLLAHKVLA